MKKTALPIFLATLWISLSEFVRNEFFLKSYWTDHYAGLGLVFPSGPVNGAVWGVWSLLFAIAIFVITRKFELWPATLLAWLMAFVMMWVVIGNMDVLPFGLLWAAVPLSFLETLVAAWIIKKLS